MKPRKRDKPKTVTMWKYNSNLVSELNVYRLKISYRALVKAAVYSWERKTEMGRKKKGFTAYKGLYCYFFTAIYQGTKGERWTTYEETQAHFWCHWDYNKRQIVLAKMTEIANRKKMSKLVTCTGVWGFGRGLVFVLFSRKEKKNLSLGTDSRHPCIRQRDMQMKKLTQLLKFLSFHALIRFQPPETGRLPHLRELKADLMKSLSIVSSCHWDWQITSWVAELKTGAAGDAGLAELPLTSCCAICRAGGQSQSCSPRYPTMLIRKHNKN